MLADNFNNSAADSARSSSGTGSTAPAVTALATFRTVATVATFASPLPTQRQAATTANALGPATTVGTRTATSARSLLLHPSLRMSVIISRVSHAVSSLLTMEFQCSSKGSFWLWDWNSNQCRDCSADTQHCGSCGNSCQAPANATPKCNNGQCSWTCNTGYTQSGNSCVKPTQPNPQDVSPLPRCSYVSVSDPSHQCSKSHGSLWFWDKDANSCRDCSSDNNNCGACGSKCTSAPQNGSPTCNQGHCDFTCKSGYTKSGNSCVPNSKPSPSPQPDCSSQGPFWLWDAVLGKCRDCSSDKQHCGSCGNSCQAPANAQASCSNGQCSWTCNQGYQKSGSSCIPAPNPNPQDVRSSALFAS